MKDIILYHWTPYEFDEFYPSRITYFTDDINFAYDYASEKSFDWAMDADIEIHKRKVYNWINLFNAENQEHINIIKDKLPNNIRIAWVWWWYQASKDEFLERLEWIYRVDNPNFLKEIDFNNIKQCIWKEYNEMSISHVWTWIINNINLPIINASKVIKKDIIVEKLYSFNLSERFWWEWYDSIQNMYKYLNENNLKMKTDNYWDIIIYIQENEILKTMDFDISKDYYYIYDEIDWRTFEWDIELIKILKNHWFDWIIMKEKKANTYAIFYPELLIKC